MNDKFKVWEKKAKLLGEYDDWVFSFEGRLSEEKGIVETVILRGYKGKKEHVILPPVDEIYRRAFEENKYIREIMIPDTIKVIWGNAFADCRQLSRVEFLCKLDYLPTRCFSGCLSLSDIIFPKNIKEILPYCFLGCSKLKHIKLPDSLKELHDYALFNTGLEQLTIPKNVEHIGYDTLALNEKLKTITFLSNKIENLRDIENKGWLLIPKEGISKIRVTSENKQLITSMLLEKQLELVEVIDEELCYRTHL